MCLWLLVKCPGGYRLIGFGLGLGFLVKGVHSCWLSVFVVVV